MINLEDDFGVAATVSGYMTEMATRYRYGISR